ncbi:hypothetical protein, partial [Mesorhizobium sp.]|uniref:hypothetical protein n=1 Tax=Mesorhizobium sp. TaxID=1871066 RepID=UPI00257C1AF4
LPRQLAVCRLLLLLQVRTAQPFRHWRSLYPRLTFRSWDKTAATRPVFRWAAQLPTLGLQQRRKAATVALPSV